MKAKIGMAIIITLAGAIICGGGYLYGKPVNDAYNEAIDLIENGSYEKALETFENTNHNTLEREDFKSDMNNSGLWWCYRDTVYLYSYAMARTEYASEPKHMTEANDYLELIPTDYSGALNEEIKAFRESFKPQYEEYLEEAEKLKNSVPYVGMSENNINDTVLGCDYEIVHNYSWRNGEKIQANVYRFRKYGKIIFVARCLNGCVDSLSDYRDDPWANGKGSASKRIEKAKNSNSTKSTTSTYSTKKSTDPYNVNDYSDPEDFYDDNFDDFWDYEDAEDYYNEHYDD